MSFLPWNRQRAQTPMDLTFSEVHRARPVDLVSPGFVEHTDRFDGQKGLPYEQLAPAPESRLGRVDRRYSSLSVSGEKPFFTVFRSPTAPDLPYAAVVADVTAFAAHGQEQDAVFAGLVKDERNYVMAWFSAAAGTAGVDAVVEGRLHTVAAGPARITAPCRVGFVLTGTWVGACVEHEDGLRPVAAGRLPEAVDLRRPDTLAGFRHGFGVRSSTGSVTLDGVQAGLFGQVGLRDVRMVTNADGTPYTRMGRYFLTATHAGLGFAETAHWGVWKLDPANHRLDHVAKLLFRRDRSDALLGDHSGHLVRDEADDRWVVATSTWGDFDGEHVGVAYTTVPLKRDLLQGVHVLGTEPLPLPLGKLPTDAVGQWDPHLVRADDRWHVAFANARAFFDVYPALAVSEPGGPLTDLALAGADAAKGETAGVALTRVGGRWYVLASNGPGSAEEDRGRFAVYDVAMNEVGSLPAPHPSGVAWPNVFAAPVDRRRSRWVMVTFDGTAYDEKVLGYGTHGDLVVLHSRPSSGSPADLVG